MRTPGLYSFYHSLYHYIETLFGFRKPVFKRVLKGNYIVVQLVCQKNWMGLVVYYCRLQLTPLGGSVYWRSAEESLVKTSKFWSQFWYPFLSFQHVQCGSVKIWLSSLLNAGDVNVFSVKSIRFFKNVFERLYLFNQKHSINCEILLFVFYVNM